MPGPSSAPISTHRSTSQPSLCSVLSLGTPFRLQSSAVTPDKHREGGWLLRAPPRAEHCGPQLAKVPLSDGARSWASGVRTSIPCSFSGVSQATAISDVCLSGHQVPAWMTAGSSLET